MMLQAVRDWAVTLLLSKVCNNFSHMVGFFFVLFRACLSLALVLRSFCLAFLINLVEILGFLPNVIHFEWHYWSLFAQLILYELKYFYLVNFFLRKMLYNQHIENVLNKLNKCWIIYTKNKQIHSYKQYNFICSLSFLK